MKGGGLRAEGLTLLPPGGLFLILCKLSFGLFSEESLEDGSLLSSYTRALLGNHNDKENHTSLSEWQELYHKRFGLAIDFYNSTKDLGEELVCFSDKTRELVALFDGVDGYNAECWDVESNPMTRQNLSSFRNNRTESPGEIHAPRKPPRRGEKGKNSSERRGNYNIISAESIIAERKGNPNTSELQDRKQLNGDGPASFSSGRSEIVVRFPEEQLAVSQRLFSITLPDGEQGR